MRLPGARRNRRLPTTQTPTAHQHPVPIPVLPQLTCLQTVTREKGTKKAQGEGGKGTKLCIVKRFVLQAPCLPPPLKAIGCNSKKHSREDKAEEIGEKEESFSFLLREPVGHGTNDLEGEGSCACFWQPPLPGRSSRTLASQGEPGSSNPVSPKDSGEEPTRPRWSRPVLQVFC